jgi:hypothetical protein
MTTDQSTAQHSADAAAADRVDPVVKQTCRYCEHWDWHGDEFDGPEGNLADGWCKRYPPVNDLQPLLDDIEGLPDSAQDMSYNHSHWPTTLHHWWCGEWKDGSV